jgi:hypothetical protein
MFKKPFDSRSPLYIARRKVPVSLLRASAELFPFADARFYTIRNDLGAMFDPESGRCLYRDSAGAKTRR